MALTAVDYIIPIVVLLLGVGLLALVIWHAPGFEEARKKGVVRLGQGRDGDE